MGILGKKVAKGGLAKKLVSGAASLALCAGLMPSMAFAAASGGADDTGYYTLPSTYISDLNHNAGSGSSAYSYRYLTSGISRIVGGFSQSMYYLMGINGVNFDRGLRNGAPWNNVSNGTLTANHVTAVDGIMGTEVNSVPDEYLWNSCVYMNQNPDVDLKTVSRADTFNNKMVWVYQGAGNPSSYELVNVEVGDQTYSMPSVIYMEANFISNNDPDWASGKSIAEWVDIEKQREGGSADYDPYVTTWTTNSGGIHYGVELMYEFADAIDDVTMKSADANGNATVMSRYVNANGDRSEEGLYDSAEAIAEKYEDFAKATQYYMLDKFANGGVKKKVTAVICGYDPGTGSNMDGTSVSGSYTGEAAYACRIYDPEITGLTNDTANFGGRPANSVMNISTDINTVLSENDVAFPAADGQQNVVRWYTAKQIAETADAVIVTDVPYGNNIVNYLAKNSAGDTQMIYSVDNSNYTKMNENVEPLVAACSAAGAKADVYYKFPSHLFGVWYAQGFENCWFAPMSAAWLYPEEFTSIENVMAYAAKNFWHIKAADVNGVLAATCSDLSMPSGSTFGTPDSDYEAVVDGIIDAGNAYYLSSKSVRNKIAALNCGDLVTHDLGALEDRTAATSLASATVSVSNQTYTGKALTPVPTVTVYGETLSKDVDYTVSYSANTNVGTATVVVKGKGDYAGQKTATFKIAKAANTLKASAKAQTVKVKTLKKKAVTVKAVTVSGAKGAVTYAKASGSSKFTVNKKTGKITIKKNAIKKGKKATVKVKVTAAGNANYNGVSKTVTVTIRAK